MAQSPEPATAFQPQHVNATEAVLLPFLEGAGPTAVPRGSAWAEALSGVDARRALNVGVAALLILLLAPLMLVIAVLVKLSSPGPVIYRQARVGVDRRNGSGGFWQARRRVDFGGQLFTIYKFRTMRIPGDVTPQVWASPDDDRSTPIGKVLRKHRLDELPQLFNVLNGDMNIVGPRPEQPSLFLTLREDVDQYEKRQRVLPGITGWAQINQSYDTSVDDVRRKVRYDLEYIAHASALTDLKILCMTVPVMLFKKGAW